MTSGRGDTAVADAKLVLDNVGVAYGDRVVLDGIDLVVAAGETVAVVGPSGSGKSTLLRAIAGLEPLTGGRVLLDGRDLTGVATHRRGVGLMFQDHALFPHLSVADNVAYGLRHGVAPERVTSVERRVAEMLELVGLAGFDRRPIDQLSGGEAQRVALARALAPSPSLLMLDEPLGSLDRVLREQLVSDLDELLTRMGQTAIHVTHDQREAFALADRVAVLTDGRLVRVGTPQELWEDPGTRFVATFLGRPNIWTVESAGVSTVAGEAARPEVQARWVETGHILGPVPPTVAWPSGGALIVVPVDAIHAVPASSPSPNHSVSGTVTSSQFDAGDHRHVVAVGDGGHSLTFVDRTKRSVGESVTVTVDLGAAIVLSATPGA